MTEERVAVATGLNPHYRPPVMKWNHVDIVLPVGFQAGVIHDGFGDLVLMVRAPGQDWPHGMDGPKKFLTIEEGYTTFNVTDDTLGPPRDHAFEPGLKSDPNGCRRCRLLQEEANKTMRKESAVEDTGTGPGN